MGDTPLPLTEKLRYVVFDRFPKRLLTKLSKNDLGKIGQGFKALTEDRVFNNHPLASHDLGFVILLVINQLSSLFLCFEKERHVFV